MPNKKVSLRAIEPDPHQHGDLAFCVLLILLEVFLKMDLMNLLISSASLIIGIITLYLQIKAVSKDE